MKKRKISLIINALVVILEIIGFIITINNNHKVSIEYYTEDSNILALISSLIFSYCLISNKEIPKYANLLKYITTICLTVTLLVVLFVLIPMYNFNFNYFLFKGGLLYQHLLCPILVIISFIFFDNAVINNKKDMFLGLSFTFIYAIVLIVLNILKIVKGPYPFLMVRSQSIPTSCMWFIMLTILDVSIAYFLAVIQLKCNKEGES